MTGHLALWSKAQSYFSTSNLTTKDTKGTKGEQHCVDDDLNVAAHSSLDTSRAELVTRFEGFPDLILPVLRDEPS